jgi:hypothetical protein
MKFLRIVFKVCVIVVPMRLQDSGGYMDVDIRVSVEHVTRTVPFSLMIPAWPHHATDRPGMINTNTNCTKGHLF